MSRTSIKARSTTKSGPAPAPRSRAKGADSPTAAVGRIGRLALEYVRRGDSTVFARTSCQTPWHLFPPIYLDDSGSAYTLLLNPSGGLVGGDRLSVDLSVGSKAHVVISSPSANRVYRSLSDPSVQAIQAHVKQDGRLEWLPEQTIPFAGSRFRQSIDVTLEAGATLLLWDAMASGRIAREERWAFASFENDIRIRTASGAIVRERVALNPADKPGGVGAADDWDYLATLFVVGDAVDGATWTALDATLAGILEQHHGQVLGGVSQPAVPGLAVKLAAKSAPAMNAVFTSLWGAVRQSLWSLSPLNLRKY